MRDSIDINLLVNTNALQQNIQEPIDLDMLWVEFIVTGNRQAIVRIVDVLERPDRIENNFKPG